MMLLFARKTAKIKENTLGPNMRCHLFRPRQGHLHYPTSSLIRNGMPGSDLLNYTLASTYLSKQSGTPINGSKQSKATEDPVSRVHQIQEQILLSIPQRTYLYSLNSTNIFKVSLCSGEQTAI